MSSHLTFGSKEGRWYGEREEEGWKKGRGGGGGMRDGVLISVVSHKYLNRHLQNTLVSFRNQSGTFVMQSHIIYLYLIPQDIGKFLFYPLDNGRSLVR